MKNQAITKKSLDYGFVWNHIKGRLNSHFSLVYMPCFPIRFVNRNDKEINVFLFFSLLYKPNLGYYSLLDKHMM